MNRWRLGILLLLLVAGGLAWAALARPAPAGAQASIIGLTATPGSADYERVTGPVALAFPRDFGPHPGYLTEWWYYTGNLQAADGRHFGYQVTFFRRATQPQAGWQPRPSDWATNQVYMAHFTLTDVAGQGFHAFERFERGAVGLAGAQGEPDYRVWLRDWSVEQTGEGAYHLRAAEDGFRLDLDLVDRKGIVEQGEQGYSRKGPEPGNASIYYSQPRLETGGTITLAGQAAVPVSGLSWLDREISTSALSQGQVGWDWFSLQLDDGSELMVYAIRRADGTVDPFSSGTYIAPDGSTRALRREDFQIAAAGTWRSPHSGGVYPNRWTVSVPSLGLELQIQPLLADQELNLSVVYWEGAVTITGARDGQPLSGSGYVELTGYARSLQGTL